NTYPDVEPGSSPGRKGHPLQFCRSARPPLRATESAMRVLLPSPDDSDLADAAPIAGEPNGMPYHRESSFARNPTAPVGANQQNLPADIHIDISIVQSSRGALSHRP